MRGKTIVVTGAFGALGRAVAAAAAERGANVAAIDHAASPPAGLVEQLGPNALILGGVDLSSYSAAKTAMAQVKIKFGRLDALLNIAGGFQWETVEGGRPESWDHMYAMNLKTTLFACQGALPYLLESGSGRIVNVGAQSALHPRVRIRRLRGEQVRSASADGKPRRRTEAEGRDGERRAPVNHRHAGQPPRHAEGGFRSLG